MSIWAKESESGLTYPQADEFIGIVNFLENEPALRARGYMPTIGDPDDRPGYEATPSTWTVRRSSEIRIEPRQIPGSRELIDTPVEVDTSTILVTAWTYEAIPADEPDDEPEEASSSEIDFDAMGDLPQTFSKWELIQAWDACGDIDHVLSSAAGRNNLLAAWASLPDQIDLRVMLTKWAAQVAMYNGGGLIDQAIIGKWLTWIKNEREHNNE